MRDQTLHTEAEEQLMTEVAFACPPGVIRVTADDYEKFAKKVFSVSGLRLQKREPEREPREDATNRGGVNPSDYRMMLDRYIEVCGYLMGYARKTGKMMEPHTFHHAMFNGIPGVSGLAGVMREAIPGLFQGVLPLAEYRDELLDDWLTDTNRLIVDAGGRGKEKDMQAAKRLYFRFLCIEPFLVGNLRAAHAYYNTLLVMVGGPWRIPRYKGCRKEGEQFRRFQRGVFAKTYAEYLKV